MKKLLPLLLCMLFSAAAFAQKPYTFNINGNSYTYTTAQAEEYYRNTMLAQVKALNAQLPLKVTDGQYFIGIYLIGNCLQFTYRVDYAKSDYTKAQINAATNIAKENGKENMNTYISSLGNQMPPEEWQRLFTEIGAYYRFVYLDSNNEVLLNFNLYPKDVEFTTVSQSASSSQSSTRSSVDSMYSNLKSLCSSMERSNSNYSSAKQSGYKTFDCELFSFQYPATLEELPKEEDDDDTVLLQLEGDDIFIGVGCESFNLNVNLDVWDDDIVNLIADGNKDEGYKLKKKDRIRLQLGKDNVHALRAVYKMNWNNVTAMACYYYVIYRGSLLMFYFLPAPNDGDYSRFEELLRGVTLK